MALYPQPTYIFFEWGYRVKLPPKADQHFFAVYIVLALVLYSIFQVPLELMFVAVQTSLCFIWPETAITGFFRDKAQRISHCFSTGSCRQVS